MKITCAKCFGEARPAYQWTDRTGKKMWRCEDCHFNDMEVEKKFKRTEEKRLANIKKVKERYNKIKNEKLRQTKSESKRKGIQNTSEANKGGSE